MRELFTHHERYDDVIYINFGLQSDERTLYRLMKTGSVWNNHSKI